MGVTSKINNKNNFVWIFFQTNNLTASRYLGESCMWGEKKKNTKMPKWSKVKFRNITISEFFIMFNMKKNGRRIVFR